MESEPAAMVKGVSLSSAAHKARLALQPVTVWMSGALLAVVALRQLRAERKAGGILAETVQSRVWAAKFSGAASGYATGEKKTLLSFSVISRLAFHSEGVSLKQLF